VCELVVGVLEFVVVYIYVVYCGLNVGVVEELLDE